MSEKTLFLLDGHALVYRAHYAFIQRPLFNSKGMNVSAATGFTRSLWDVLKNQKPTHIAVSFDLKGPTFRHEMYEPYKANRDAQPEDITTSLPYIEKIIKAFNIPVVTKEGFEADDVIGTLAKQAEKEGFKVYMMTPDKDYAQLVSDNIFLYKPGRKGGGVEVMGVPEVLEKWNIENVDQVIDMLGLQGDSVDNIPGIPGIGPKTASTLLKKYGSVENLIANSADLKGKQKERVEEFADQGLLSKKLATIDINVPVKFDAKEYQMAEMDREAMAALFKELEFRRLSDQILGPTEDENVQKDLFGNTVVSKSSTRAKTSASSTSSASNATNNIHNVDHEYFLMDTSAKRKELVKKMQKLKTISFDTETTNIDANKAELVGLVFSFKEKEAYYVPIPEDLEEAKAICKEFKGVLENPKVEIIGQNIKYDMLVMRWYDIHLDGKLFDTMIAHYLLEPDLRHKLDFLAESLLQYKMVPIENLIGKRGKNQLSMRDVSIAKASDYACEDADITLQIKEILQPKLKENELLKLYDEIEIPLVKVLSEIEYNGFRINPEFFADYSKLLQKSIDKKEKEIYKQADVVFNIASPRQVGEVLFDKLKITYRWKKTKQGQYSTSEEKLTELAVKNKIVSDILEYRGLTKLKSTYVDALPLLINPKTQRVHSSFNQARAATGRLSSENPNLQNIPIKTEVGREIRKAFEPRSKDFLILAADYSQIELRLIAEISKDEAMLDAFIKGLDIHTATAAKVYEVPLEEVTADQRRNAKTVNFSITYGAGSTNLARQLKIKRGEAKELIENYFKQYKGLKEYMDKTVAFAREMGYVTTLLGRKRFLRDIDSRNGLTRSNAERVAINTPIQGTAADMIKVAMINIHNAMKKENYKSKMILQVHDELVFDVHKDEVDQLTAMIEDKMKNAIPNLTVPIKVGIGLGNNWLEAH